MRNRYFIPSYYNDSIVIFKSISSSCKDDVRKIYLDTGEWDEYKKIVKLLNK